MLPLNLLLEIGRKNYMSADKKADNAYGVLKSLISLFKSVNSLTGKINISFSILIVLIILAFVLTPLTYYILYGVFLTCNMVLSLCNKNPLSLEVTPPPWWLVLLCIIFVVVESFLCLYLISYSEREKNMFRSTKKHNAKHLK